MDWSKKRVFITGHTGFKGAWLTQLLTDLGADVCGYALEPDTKPALFNQLGLERNIQHHIGNIQDFDYLQSCIKSFRPDVIFHLAAQPLVRLSYDEPVDTWATNVQGTVNLFEAARSLDNACNIVAITTDKVYKNLETGQAYQETDRLGGYDPYSASKAACELVISSYRDSFFSSDSGINLASARAGNVIGGGDWALDRIVPDIIRALSNSEKVIVRNPHAVRPWQHVLDPLFGYMRLAECMDLSKEYHSAYNFGPETSDECSVGQLVEAALKVWPGSWEDQSDPNQKHEANLLSLDISKAKKELNWQPVWNFNNSIRKTIEWYRLVEEGENPSVITRNQIAEFVK